ncbi:MAG: hypothetical protein ABSD44_06745 [Terracidiphilus sp.]|jgi:hypothetical protein
MTNSTPCSKVRVRGKWLFLGGFVFSCFLFWWLQSILVRDVLRMADAVEDETIGISVLALACFIAGYFLSSSGRPKPRMPEHLLDACGNFAYKATLAIFIPSLLIAVQLLRTYMNFDYGSGGSIPRVDQAVLYIHLFFGFMYFGAADPEKQGTRRLWIATVVVTLPRLIIAIHGARFVLAQAVVPALLIAVARGWIHLSLKRFLQIAALAAAIIFVPALTRGDDLIGQDEIVHFFVQGSSLKLLQDNTDLSLDERCPPFFVSLTAKVIPWGVLGVCTIDSGGLKDMPATLARILTNNDPLSFHGTVAGSGTLYLLELYVTGGMIAVYAGSALFGFSCRLFVGWLNKRSLFSGIWAECLTRALVAPRGNLSYVYERIPSLLLATMLVILTVWALELLKREQVAPAAALARAFGG